MLPQNFFKLFTLFSRILMIGLLISFSSFHQTTNKQPFVAIDADAILGQWSLANNQLSIEIFRDEAEYKGRIVWLKTPNDEEGFPKLDVLNPEKRLRSQPILNMVNMTGFTFNPSDNLWENGYIYNPLNGTTIKGTLKMTSQNTIKMTGFVGFSLAMTTEVWTRM